MKITNHEVAQMAALARIEVNEAEIVEYTGDLNKILEYIARLNELDTTDVQPTVHALPLHNVWREDEVQLCLTNEQALANAAETEDGMYRVPRVIE